MINLGMKRGVAETVPTTGPGKPYICYPSMSIELKQMPFLKGTDIDDEITITFKCKVKSINKYNDGDTTYGLDLIEAEKEKGKSNE